MFANIGAEITEQRVNLYDIMAVKVILEVIKFGQSPSVETRVPKSTLVWLDPILNMLLLVHTSILTDQQESLHYPSPPYTFRLLKLLSCLLFAVQKPDTFDTVNRKRLNFFYTLYTSMWLNWLKDRLKMLCEESFAQREQVKLLSRPKKCYFHSRMCDFWQTMMSEKESSIST